MGSSGIERGDDGGGPPQAALLGDGKLLLHLKIWEGGKYFEAGKRKKNRQKLLAEIGNEILQGGGKTKIQNGQQTP